MDIKLEKQIQERFLELPADVQRAIQSEDVDKKLQAIGTKHQLHIDQLGVLGDETRMVMMGFIDPTDFVDSLTKQLGIPEDKSELIATDINDELFIPIRESMQEYAEQKVLQEVILKTPLNEAGKSVVMPSAAVATASTPSVAISTVAQAAPLSTDMQIDAPSSVSASAPVPKPAAPAPQMYEADVMLSEPTVSLPAVSLPNLPQKIETLTTKTEVPQPAPAYKADPYREPVE